MNGDSASDELFEAFGDLLGKMAADVRLDLRKDIERHSAETRAILSELKAAALGIEAALRASVEPMIAAAIAKLTLPQGPLGPQGEPGTPDMSEVATLVARAVNDALTARTVEFKGPPGEKGDLGQQGERGEPGAIGPTGPQGVPGMQGEKGDSGSQGECGETGPGGAAGPQGEAGPIGANGIPGEIGPQGEIGPAGADVDPESVAVFIADEVSKAVLALPPAPRGEKGDIGAPGERGPSGVGLSGALIDRDGMLILTLGDGTLCKLGVVNGIDGKDGAPGRDGINGKDGFSLKDMSVEFDGERTLTFTFADENVSLSKTIALPYPLDRGVWKDGTEYVKGDVVTWGGGMFVAQDTTTGRPETDKTWRLAVKRGRQGEAGKDGKDGPQGPPGRPGRAGG